MNQFFNHAQAHVEGPGRAIWEDGSGRLFDRRLRDMLAREGEVGPESGADALEALSALRAAAKGMRVLLDRWADRHGLSEGRLHLMLSLKRSSARSLAVGELATALDVSPRNVTGLVDHLEADGLVRRTDDPSDRRAVLVELTEAGAAKISLIWREALEAQCDLAEGFSHEELAQLRHLCLRLVRRIDSLHPMAAPGGGAQEVNV